MVLRDMAVVLDECPQSEARLRLAIDLARRNGAYLAGICPAALLRPAGQSGERTARIERMFRDQLRSNDVLGDWQAPTGDGTNATVRLTRTRDLVVLGQADPEHPAPPAARSLVRDVLTLSGRPVLIVPFAGEFRAPGRQVLIGWTAARASARAVADSLALIDKRAKVTVLTVRDPGIAEWPNVPGAAVAEHLARHGLDATAAQTVTDHSISDADALLNYASDIGADLLVTGGYSHSRTREAVLGGVTRALLDHMTLPVLMSH